MLRGRVREAVAGEVGKAVAEAVADVLTAALGGRLVRLNSHAGRYDPYASQRSRHPMAGPIGMTPDAESVAGSVRFGPSPFGR